MTLEEYLNTPFKTDGNGGKVLIKEEWDSLSRSKRRYVKNQLKKGKVPSFFDLFSNDDF